MDYQTISAKIQEEIKTLRKARNSLLTRSEDKANALGAYEKKLAQTMIQLRNGQVVELDGKEVSYTSATGLEKIAKGCCYKESIALDIAESNLRNAHVSMRATESIINALQSLLRYEE